MALSALEGRERRLAKDKLLQGEYSNQVQDFVKRGVLKKLTKEELDVWKGPVRCLVRFGKLWLGSVILRKVW